MPSYPLGRLYKELGEGVHLVVYFWYVMERHVITSLKVFIASGAFSPRPLLHPSAFREELPCSIVSNLLKPKTPQNKPPFIHIYPFVDRSLNNNSSSLRNFDE